MSSSLYIGPPGVGKTTALVRYVILPALERQQRVVTNVPLNEAAFCDRLGMNLDGLIVLVTSDQIRAPNFWFTAQGIGETITQGGDCIVIDECHEFYGPDQKIKSDAEVFRAVRLQRKYTGGSGNFSTNIVFATQLYEDMTRSLRNVCDSMYYMQKLTVVGKSDSYRVDIFADCRKAPTRGTPVQQLFGTYDPEYYALYNSYSTGVGGFTSTAPGVETVTDDRLNIWNRKIGIGPLKLTMKQAKYVAIGVAVLSFFAFVFFLYSSLSKPVSAVPAIPKQQEASAPAASASAPAALAPGMAPMASAPVGAPSGVHGKPSALAPAPASKLGANDSKEYRLAGFYQLGGTTFAVVADRSGAYHYLMSGAFSDTDFVLVNAGPATHIKFKDEVIAPWTGAPAATPSGSHKMEMSK